MRPCAEITLHRAGDSAILRMSTRVRLRHAYRKALPMINDGKPGRPTGLRPTKEVCHDD